MIVTLPIELKERIDILINSIPGRKKINEARITHFLSELYSKSIIYSGLCGQTIDLLATDIKKELGRNYKPILNALEASGILSINHSYKTASDSKGKSYSKTYHLSSDFLKGNLMSYSFPDSVFNVPEVLDIPNRSIEILKECQLDKEAAYQEVDSLINNEKRILSKVIRQDQIKEEWLPRVRIMSNKAKAKWRKFKVLTKIRKETLLDKFYEESFELIKSDKRYYYMPLNYYLEEKKRNVKYSYHDSINRFYEKDFFFSTDKNGRIYTNICNMSNDLLKYITIKNEPFIEIDLKNSQWNILDYCVRNLHLNNLISQAVLESRICFASADYRRFARLSHEGQLYEYIQNKMAYKSRNQAKEGLFEILFGRNFKEDSTSKKALRNEFPTLVKFCDFVKRKHSYKSLSNQLQKIESSIFIDTILKKLHIDNLKTLSKHDSFLIPRNEYGRTYKIITNQIDNILGKGNFLLK